jgi:hypothetical protein
MYMSQKDKDTLSGAIGAAGARAASLLAEDTESSHDDCYMHGYLQGYVHGCDAACSIISRAEDLTQE